MEQQERFSKVNIEKIIQLTQKKNQIKQTDQCVVLIGMTGAGKSTLINLLINKKMKIISVNQRFMLQLVDSKQLQGLKAAKIGNSYNAQTSFPQIFQDTQNDISYCDCPGFLDTKGAQYDIANAIYIKYLFKQIKRVKIMLVVGAQQLQGRAIHFVEKIQKLYHMLSNFGLIKKSIILVITKAIKSEEHYALDLKNILKSRQQFFYDEQYRQYFTQLIKKCQPLIFENPKNLQDQVQLTQKDNIQKIKNALNELQYVEGLQIEHIPISAQSQKVLFQLTQQYQIYLNQRLSKWVDQIDQFCNSKNDKIQLFYILKQARVYLKLIEVLPKDINNQNSFIKLKNTINDFMNLLNIKTGLVSILQILKFCFDSNNFCQQNDSSQLQFFKLTAIELCILQYLRDIKKNLSKNIQSYFQSLQPKFYELITKSSIEELQKIRYNIKDLLEVQDKKQFFQKYSKILCFQISIKQIPLIVNCTQKQNENLIICPKKNKSDNLISLVNQHYKKRDPEFNLISQVFVIMKSFFTRKSQQIHKIIIQRLKNNTNSNENQTLKKRLMEIQLSRQNRLQMIKNGKISYQGRRNGLFLKGFSISLAIVTNQINNHLMSQLAITQTQSIQSLNKKQQKKPLFSIGSTDRSDKSTQDSQRKNMFFKYEYTTIGFYCFVFAGDQIYIDDDFQSYCNMLFVAPKIIIKKNNYGQRPIITLRGFDGQKIKQKKSAKKVAHKSDFDDCQRDHYKIKGQKGKDGNPGFPGANMTLIAKQFIGLQYLTVDLSGGNGSNGQDGGDGADCNFSYMTKPKKGHGGDGGNGGNGGAKGKVGFFNIYDYQGNPLSNSKVRLIGRQGNLGNPGKGGQGGIPWDKGKKQDKKKFKYGRTGQDGSISQQSLKYSNLVLRQCQFQYLKTNYSRDFYLIYKDTNHQNFFQKKQQQNQTKQLKK